MMTRVPCVADAGRPGGGNGDPGRVETVSVSLAGPGARRPGRCLSRGPVVGVDAPLVAALATDFTSSLIAPFFPPFFALLFASGLLATAAIAAAPDPDPGCTPVPVLDWRDALRPGEGGGTYAFNEPRVKLVEGGNYCLATDLTLGPVARDPHGNPVTVHPGVRLVSIAGNGVKLDLAGHRLTNTWVPEGLRVVGKHRWPEGEVTDPGPVLRTVLRNGTVVSPGSAGVGVELRLANVPFPPDPRDGREPKPAVIPDGQSKADYFPETAHRIEDLVIEAGDVGIRIEGRNNVIRNNRIVVEGDLAIVAIGPGLVLENNEIEVRGRRSSHAELYGRRWLPIQLIQADDAIVRNNRIRYTGSLLGHQPEGAFELIDSPGIRLDDNQIEGIPALDWRDRASPPPQ